MIADFEDFKDGNLRLVRRFGFATDHEEFGGRVGLCWNCHWRESVTELELFLEQ